MKKTIVILLSVLLLLPSLALFAAADQPRVVDEADLFTADQETALNAQIDEIGKSFSFDVAIVTVNDLGGKSAMDYADDYYDSNGYGYGENHDGCLLLIHMDEDRGYWITTTGSGIDAINDDDLDAIDEDIVPLLSVGEYAKACFVFTDDVRALLASADGEIPALPSDIITYGANGAEGIDDVPSLLTDGAATVTTMPRVVDQADLFTVDEELALNEKIARVASEFSFDVVILTVTNLYNKSAMAFADDFYDYGGYGYNENNDGCLLLIHMDEDRGYWISTTGLGIKALSDADIDRIGDDIVPSLSAGQYAAACDTFIDDVYEEVNIEINGRGFRPMLLIIGLVIGLVIALIVVGVLKGQLKSVRSKPSANDYYVDGSLALTGAYDVLVGHHVTRTKRESSSSSSGGSSTHTGSSGTSHGGGGGRF